MKLLKLGISIIVYQRLNVGKVRLCNGFPSVIDELAVNGCF